MASKDYFKRSILLYLSGLVLLCSTGCPVVSNLSAPGRCLTQQDPEFARKYYLYVPTSYNDRQKWAIVVTCHGTVPFDTASRQFDEWKGLAEQKGFLLIAPELVGTSGIHPQAEQQIALQMEDEAAILSIIRAVKAARSVDENRIFLTGWSAGAYAVLFTGLRHPDVFRALSIRQGNFNTKFFEPCVPFLDRYQPIQMTYGHIDPIDRAEDCITWLRNHDMEPDVLERPGIHKRDPLPVYLFFKEVVSKRPWVRVNVHDDPVDAMKVGFSVKASFEPRRYLWDFGDGQKRSPVAAPEHWYEKPGMYTVKVAVWFKKDKHYVRSIQLQIPRIHLGARPPTTAPE
ncbi:MAG: prolyl oligopeptidase family serine peptidase [Planctomycetota bacterium]|nr:MAG: prolyl oligopeptidase family serine peptidase [Planctomycetota bacterium]